MSLRPGVGFGPYDVQSLRGAGGMGEVHKARDNRLDPAVAPVVLPSGIASNPECRVRSEWEAAIFGLHCLPICTLRDASEMEFFNWVEELKAAVPQ